MQKLLSLPIQILLSARYLSLPHLCLLCGRGRWRACLRGYDLPHNHRGTWPPLKGDLPIRLPNFFIHFRPRGRKGAPRSRFPSPSALALPGYGWLAPGSGVPQSARGEGLKVRRGQTLSVLLKFSPHAVCFSVDS